MKAIILFGLCIVSCLAVPYDVTYNGYDGTEQHEEGHPKQLPGDREGPVNVKSGYVQFVGTDGKTYREDWTADERGFIAKGDHLPTSPPLPVVKRP